MGFLSMHVEEDSDKKRLRVVDEDVETEEVLRLGDKGKGGAPVERVPLPRVPEVAPRLEKAGGLEDFDRRSLEPDIDSIMPPGESGNFGGDMEWMTSEEKKPVPYGWFILIFLLLGGLLATSAILILRSDSSDVEVAKQAAVERVEENKEDEAEAEALVEAIEDNLTRYIGAESVEDLIPLVRDPERVGRLMEDWYRRHPIRARKFDGLGVFQPLDLEGRLFWLITCLVKGDKSETILMEQTEDGRVFVDWETQVCYQPMAWNDYVGKRPEGESIDFRVYLQVDWGGFYSHEFSDEERWRVYRLWTRDSEEYLFGYVPRGSELEARLNKLCEANRGSPVALLLRLRIPEGSTSPRGVLIEEIISERWARVTRLTGE
jgi:hypothetical protein